MGRGPPLIQNPATCTSRKNVSKADGSRWETDFQCHIGIAFAGGTCTGRNSSNTDPLVRVYLHRRRNRRIQGLPRIRLSGGRGDGVSVSSRYVSGPGPRLRCRRPVRLHRRRSQRENCAHIPSHNPSEINKKGIVNPMLELGL